MDDLRAGVCIGGPPQHGSCPPGGGRLHSESFERSRGGGRKKASSSPSERLTARDNVCTYIHCIMHAFRARNVLRGEDGRRVPTMASVALSSTQSGMLDVYAEAECPAGSARLRRKQASLQRKVHQSRQV